MLLAGLLLGGGVVRGQAGVAAMAPATMPAKGPPVRVITTSLASLANLEALAKEVGGDLPTWLTADGLGEMFPFLGKGSIDPDKPVALGVYLSGGDMATEVASGKGIVIVLPLNADKGTVEDSKEIRHGGNGGASGSGAGAGAEHAADRGKSDVRADAGECAEHHRRGIG